MRGTDNGEGRDPDADSRTALMPGGASGDNVGSLQADAFQGHWHNLRRSDIASGTTSDGGITAGTITGDQDVQPAKEAISDYTNGTPRISSETRPTNVAVSYIIKL